jgi:toxin ParE1/3/4
MKVALRQSALDDLDHIYDWIARDNPRAASQMVSRLRDRISLLEIDALAHMGRPGLVAGTRELIEYPYIIVYMVEERAHEIVALPIMHGAQDRSP